MSIERIGIFGGTFDPVHNGHIQLANRAIQEVELTKLLFVPAANPPHKNEIIASFKHRIAMLELVCKGSKHFLCSSIEAELPKPSYTVDTLTELMTHYPTAELYFIIGGDAFLDLLTWKSYKKILSMVKIIISPRVGYSNNRLHIFLSSLGYTQSGEKWQGKNGQKDIILLSKSPQDSCSSMIRDVIAKKGDATHLLPQKVAAYIQENSLYNP